MSHIDNKVNWCLKKGEKEQRETGRHRGLIRVQPDMTLAMQHIKKAEHNLKAIIDFDNAGYSDWSASAAFYCIYHSLLGVLSKYGYKSQNQECTFALIYKLIDDGVIVLDKNLLEEVFHLDPKGVHESTTIISIRESEQYGTVRSMEKDRIIHFINVSKRILDTAKEIVHN